MSLSIGAYIIRTTQKVFTNSSLIHLSSQPVTSNTMPVSQPHEQLIDAEDTVKRNPHGDFSAVQASRPDWSDASAFHFTKTRNPNWKLGDGANDNGESLKKNHVEIDPYSEGRPAIFNYKLLISAIVPRPIGFISTRSKDGELCFYTLCLMFVEDFETSRGSTEAYSAMGIVLMRLGWNRIKHEPRALQLHTANKPRPTHLHHRLCRRPRPPKGQSPESHRDARM